MGNGRRVALVACEKACQSAGKSINGCTVSVPNGLSDEHGSIHKFTGTLAPFETRFGEAVLFFSPFSGPKKGSGQLKLISQGRRDKGPFLGSLLLPLAGPRVLAAGCVLHYQQI